MRAPIISKVVVEPGPGHDRVRVWNRGALAGELVLTKGDGARVAALLLNLRDALEAGVELPDGEPE